MIFNLEPCLRDKRGRNVADYTTREHYEKLSEELLEAHEAAVAVEFDDRGTTDVTDEIWELLHVMTVCAARIKAIADEFHISDEQLAQMQKDVIKHNRKRGYLKIPAVKAKGTANAH